MGFKNALMALGVPNYTAQRSVGTCTTGLTATGSTQATALLVTDDNNVFTTVAASTGALLPVNGVSGGDWCQIANNGANTLTVYPPTGGKINNGTTNAGVSVATLKAALFTSIDGTNWFFNLGG